MIIFEKLRYKNFLSTGNIFTEINFTDHKMNLISGKNGGGKCLRGNTKTNIKFKNKDVEKKFKDFMKNIK